MPVAIVSEMFQLEGKFYDSLSSKGLGLSLSCISGHPLQIHLSGTEDK